MLEEEKLNQEETNEELHEEVQEVKTEEILEQMEETGESDTDNIEESDEEGTQKKEKSKFFKKDKKEKKDPKDEKIEELNDRLIRTMAEFDNFRKRSEKEKSQMFELGAKDIIERILPVIDNFERGLDTISEEEREGAFAQGIEKIYKQLTTTLEEVGVKAIEAVGNEFDPNLHNAVMHADDEEQGENIITDEFQKGYMYKDTVVRHSMVKVVN
ncbi:molecular chaperone GrpE [Mobilisporobacter senegalensis]|uniref:Protein GrpE n=1 Tax=Mobilisporobacter senegalensis TaxID=1329262 RepID=A0A3N1XZD5_9FIRM|nr:molecular chaperone GrpE [Mobilisporobacter senegalensis]